MMTRKIYIECDGGFGNRFNSVVTGLGIARIFNLQPVIVWVISNRCMAEFYDLFDENQARLEVIDGEQFAKIQQSSELQPMYHGYDYLNNEVEFKPTPFSVMKCRDMDDLAKLVQQTQQDVYFATSLIPPYFDLGLIGSLLQQLAFNQHILQSVDAYLAPYAGRSFYGLHMRMTDFCTTEEQKQSWLNFIAQNSDKLFFVCSDSQEFEAEVSQFSNVFLYQKNSYVEKLTEGGWRANFDDEGRKMRFNVNRSAQSVIEAMVDLLILSRSEMIDTSHSTFLKTALLLRAKQRGLLKFGQTYGQHFYSK